MKTPRWKVFIWLAGLAVLVLALAIAFAAHQGKRLASPARRAIQPYHREWLDHPDRHGISIRESVQLAGKVPCLTVSLDAEAGLGQRGRTIRRQLSEQGVALQPVGKIVGNVVLLHGRNGRKEDLLPVAERFCAAGLRCIVPDLPAHGESPVPAVKFGLSDWEREFPAKLLAECAVEQGFSPTPSALWGMSMGGSYATRAVSVGGTWRCLVIVSSFDNLEFIVRDQCHSQALAGLVSHYCRETGGPDISQVVPAQWAASVRIPVLVVHGTEDSLIPKENGHALFSSFASSEKRWIEVPGGDHDNVLVTPMPLYAEMAAWMLEKIALP